MVKFFPELLNIVQMKSSPTEGEQFLLYFLKKYLGNLNGEFEIFFNHIGTAACPMSSSCEKITIL